MNRREKLTVDPRDKPLAKIISRYRKAKPGTPYHEAARAVLFDEPWATETRSLLQNPGDER